MLYCEIKKKSQFLPQVKIFKIVISYTCCHVSSQRSTYVLINNLHTQYRALCIQSLSLKRTTLNLFINNNYFYIYKIYSYNYYIIFQMNDTEIKMIIFFPTDNFKSGRF